MSKLSSDQLSEMFGQVLENEVFHRRFMAQTKSLVAEFADFRGEDDCVMYAALLGVLSVTTFAEQYICNCPACTARALVSYVEGLPELLSAASTINIEKESPDATRH